MARFRPKSGNRVRFGRREAVLSNRLEAGFLTVLLSSQCGMLRGFYHDGIRVQCTLESVGSNIRAQIQKALDALVLVELVETWLGGWGVGWSAKLSNVKHCAPCFFGGLPGCVGGSLQVPAWVGAPRWWLRSTSPCTYAQLPRPALSLLLRRQACAVCGGGHAVRGRAGFQALCWPPAHPSAPVAGRHALLPAPLLPRSPPASHAPPPCALRVTFLCFAALWSARWRPALHLPLHVRSAPPPRPFAAPPPPGVCGVWWSSRCARAGGLSSAVLASSPPVGAPPIVPLGTSATRGPAPAQPLVT